MQIFEKEGQFVLEKEGEAIGFCRFLPTAQGARELRLFIDPRWRRRGYGTYLLKDTLRRTGGFARDAGSLHTAPLPDDPAELAFWGKQGFAVQNRQLVRRRVPDLSAVKLAQEFVAARLPAPALCVDATCGNGNDTEFLCRLCAAQGAPDWKVLAMDIQPQAVENTSARLKTAGFAPPRAEVVCGDHAKLLAALQPGSADAVLFNFGWLPGAGHEVFSTADTSIPALEAALTALRAGGILSAVLYSGKVIGSDEKQAVLRWLRALPLTQYTVLVCDFANWADTAPLPCFVIKK